MLVALLTYVWRNLLHMLSEEQVAFNGDIHSRVLFCSLRVIPTRLFLHGCVVLDNAASPMLWAGVFFVISFTIAALLTLRVLIGILCGVVNHLGVDCRVLGNICII